MAAFSGKPYPCGPVFRYSTDAPVRLSSMSDGENKNWPNDDESSADFVYLHSERVRGVAQPGLEYASGGRVVASSNLVTPTDL